MVAGDIGVSHSPGFIGHLIRTGERMTNSRQWAKWNHAFVVMDDRGNTIEAGGKGVVRNNVSSHPEHLILHHPAGVDRNKIVACAIKNLGVEYGYFDDVLLGFDCLTHLKLHQHGDSLICSELATICLIAGGWKSPKSASAMLPSDLAMALEPKKAPTPMGWGR